MLVENRGTSVNRLRVRIPARDSLRVRLDYDRFFSSADVHPTNLPANAIVCINQFSAPPPLQSSQSISSGWEQKVRQSLGDIVNQAARPILGRAPGATNAVLFADMAELLACLACDWAKGSLLTNWWWRLLLRDDKSLWSIWKRHPEFIPAALQHLVRQKMAAPVLHGLTALEIQELGQKVIETFAAYSLAAAFTVRLSDDLSSKRPEPAAAPQSERRAFRPFVQRAGISRAPWRSLLPDIDFNELSLEQERFLAVCLMLQREPTRVRSPQFARAVRTWQQELAKSFESIHYNGDLKLHEGTWRIESASKSNVQSGPGSPTNEAVPHKSQDPIRRCPAQLVHENPEDNPTDTGHRDRITNHPSLTAHGPGAPVLPGHDLTTQPRTSTRPSSPPTFRFEEETATIDRFPLTPIIESSPGTTEPASCANVKTEATTDNSVWKPEIEVDQTLSEALALDPAIVVDTNLGGFFYLINLGLFLDLYADFTTPNATGIELNIWDFVTVVGAELIEGQFPNDPIWPLLENLAGREDTMQAGGDFVVADDWRITPEWLVPFAKETEWHWTLTGNRLQITHPWKFFVLNIKRDARDAAEQLSSEASAYRQFFSQLEFMPHHNLEMTSSKAQLSAGLSGWLSRLVPYVRARLKRSFGVEGHTDPGRLLCQRRARVKVTTSHVDVYFDLADLPIEIRLAGLDRDPGWVPAAGRFITFHYE